MVDILRSPVVEPGNVKALTTKIGFQAEKVRAAVAADALVRDAFESYLDKSAALVVRLERTDLRAHDVDPALDGLFRAIRLLCRARYEGYGLADQLPLTAEQQRDLERAKQVEATLVGDDLQFTQLAYLDEWREASYRLGRVDEPLVGGAETTRQAGVALGAGPLLGRLERVFQAYGQALGILSDGGTLDPAYEAFNAAQRHLLVAIEASYRDAPPPAVKEHVLDPIAATYTRQRESRRAAESRRRASRSAGDGDATTVAIAEA